MKWIAISLALVALGGIAAALYFPIVANPRNSETLKLEPDGALAGRVMLLTLPSGRTLPLNYLREGDTVYAGADGRWWRELRGEGSPVTLLVRGETLRGRARAIEDDPERTREVFTRLRPDVPSWLPGWLDAVLVVVDLEAR